MKLYQPVGNRRLVNVSDKRNQIIEVSAVLMHSKGYENTKLSDILDAAQIGKGQFYHYFSSKHELGLAVLDYSFSTWNRSLLEGILSSPKDAKSKFNDMLEWIINQHKCNQAKRGCVFGNLAVELSEHDEVFRQRLELVFEKWADKLKPVLVSLISPSSANDVEIDNLAHGVIAMIEGGILLMKSKQDIHVLINITELARILVNCFVQRHVLQKEM
jgi:TetR/AcrR family transcriptional repressor of nem operon